MKKVVVIIEGGCVQRVFADGEGIAVHVVDLDVEQVLGSATVSRVPNPYAPSEGRVNAIVSRHQVDVDPVRVEEMLA